MLANYANETDQIKLERNDRLRGDINSDDDYDEDFYDINEAKKYLQIGSKESIVAELGNILERKGKLKPDEAEIYVDKIKETHKEERLKSPAKASQKVVS